MIMGSTGDELLGVKFEKFEKFCFFSATASLLLIICKTVPTLKKSLFFWFKQAQDRLSTMNRFGDIGVETHFLLQNNLINISNNNQPSAIK